MVVVWMHLDRGYKTKVQDTVSTAGKAEVRNAGTVKQKDIELGRSRSNADCTAKWKRMPDAGGCRVLLTIDKRGGKGRPRTTQPSRQGAGKREGSPCVGFVG